MSGTDPTFFDKKTPSRRRINAEETAKGFRFNGTAEGEEFLIEVTETDKHDVAKTIKTTLGAELASMIIETRNEFKLRNIPLAIPNLKAFCESQLPPRVPLQSSVLPSAESAKVKSGKTGGTAFRPPEATRLKKIQDAYDELKKHDADKESGQ